MPDEGIEVRHEKSCRSLVGDDGAGRCNCDPTYRASVWSARDGKRIRPLLLVTSSGEGVAPGRRPGHPPRRVASHRRAGPR